MTAVLTQDPQDNTAGFYFSQPDTSGKPPLQLDKDICPMRPSK